MNERIKSIAGKALDSAVPETYTKLSPEQLQKVFDTFAELIIRECAQVIDTVYATEKPEFAVRDWDRYAEGVDILRHFDLE